MRRNYSDIIMGKSSTVANIIIMNMSTDQIIISGQLINFEIISMACRVNKRIIQVMSSQVINSK
jgi:hypothetical protein